MPLGGVARGRVQPEGLCFAVGMGIALRTLVVDSCNSPRARVGEDGMWENVDGGLIPERLVLPLECVRLDMNGPGDGSRDTHSVLVGGLHSVMRGKVQRKKDINKACSVAVNSTGASRGGCSDVAVMLRECDIQCLGCARTVNIEGATHLPRKHTLDPPRL